MVVFLAGALGEGIYQREAIQRVQPGSVISLGPYSVTFTQILGLTGPNYQTQTAELALYDDRGNFLSMMMPKNELLIAASVVTCFSAG